MRKPAGARRDLLLVIVLFAALVASGVVSSLSRSTESGQGTSYSTYSADGDGTLALYTWLGRVGYRVRRLESAPFAVPADIGALFVVAPWLAYTQAEARTLAAWVRAGGTVVLALDLNEEQRAVLDAFGARLQDLPLPPQAGAAPPLQPVPAQPLLDHPPLRRLAAPTGAAVAFDAQDSVTYLTAGAGGAPLLLARRLGRGRVFLLGAPAILSNGYIRRADNRLLPLNLLGGLPADAAVGFDEFHHGVQVQQAQDTGDLLFSTALGRALLFAAAILLAYLLLSGRRLGRPIVERRPPARSISEYIVSLGALYRRSGARADALAIVVRAFVRDVAESHHLPPAVGASHDPFALAQALRDRGALDGSQEEALRALLTPAREGTLSEAELVRRVRALDALRSALRHERAPGG